MANQFNFNDALPVAPANSVNAHFQSDGGTDIENISFNLSAATAMLLGAVKPDATTITITADGTISSVGGGGGGSVSVTHAESLTDGYGNFIFANGDIVTVVGVPN